MRRDGDCRLRHLPTSARCSRGPTFLWMRCEAAVAVVVVVVGWTRTGIGTERVRVRVPATAVQLRLDSFSRNILYVRRWLRGGVVAGGIGGPSASVACSCPANSFLPTLPTLTDVPLLCVIHSVSLLHYRGTTAASRRRRRIYPKHFLLSAAAQRRR
ncbi:hypothetical protein EDC01DRAFT_663356 [Geopyxis carbonaria]|nr:hypothetical protein EDC01DRAFT_663356 [Geopyxis carbonaria]